jgi:type I restriction enzyme S subunit
MASKYDKYKDSGVQWIGAIPEYWEVMKLKHVAKINLSNVDKKAVGGQDKVKLCNYVDVYYNSNITSDIEFMEATATKEQIVKFLLQKGDVIITKDSESPDDIAVPAYVLENMDNVVCGYHLAHIKPQKIIGSFLYYSFLTARLKDQFSISANGITRYGLGKDSIGGSLFFLPPVSEQEQIASYLHKKSEAIDKFIKNKEDLINLLEKEKRAIITKAVTKGLDPTVKLKNSGVDWLGDIPEHWEVRKLKRICQVKRGASPRPIDSPKYFDDNGEFGWVRISDVTKSDRYLEGTEQYLSKLGVQFSVKIYPGDIFLSIAGSVGKAIITKVKCCIHDGFVWFKGLKIDREFLFYLFQISKIYEGLGKEGTQLNLNTETIGSVLIPYIPNEEQKTIVAYLDQEIKKIDDLKAKYRQEIDLIKEYKERLIYDVVTGKMNVMHEV